nr:NnrU family protein [Devosia faecipullorum]
MFLLAIAVFIALHSVPAIPGIRQRLIEFLGRRTYLGLYSLASLLSLIWVFHAAFRLDYFELWPQEAWQAYFPIILTPVAFFLLLAGLMSPNPLSITARRNGAKSGAISAITRHPALWGFLLWAIGHVVANGDLRSVMLFGILTLFSIFGMVMAERRARRNADTDLDRARENTSILPFVAIAQRRARFTLDMPMLVALILSALLTAWMLLGGHAALFGADPLAMTTI